MKISTCLAFLLMLLSSATPKKNIYLEKVEINSPVTGIATTKNLPIRLEQMANMKVREVEKLIGRKLSFKEKIILKFTQKKLRKRLNSSTTENTSKGKTAFILSLLSLIFLFIPIVFIASLPLAIIGLVMGSNAKKKNPNDKKAKTAIVLSIITLGLIFVLGLIVLLVLLSGAAFF